MKKCPCCHLANTDENTFCENCGANLLTGEMPLSPAPAAQYLPYIQPAKKSKAKKPKTQKFNVKFVLIGAISGLILAVLSLIILSPDNLMAKGHYKAAYVFANTEKKKEVLKENLVAYICKEVPDNIEHDPDSFKLRDAWYDPITQRIALRVSASNAVGATISDYCYYTYRIEVQEYCLSSEEWLPDDKLKLSKTSIKHINDLFQNGMLDDVELLEENLVDE